MTSWVDPDDWDALQTAFAARSVVLFAGAGVSAAAGLPLWPRLVEILIERMGRREEKSAAVQEASENLRRGRLVDAMSAARLALGPTVFGDVVAKALDDRGKDVPVVAHAIAALRRKLHGAITTNLDRFLERASGGEWLETIKPVGNLAQEPGFLWKAHGTIQDRASWVFARAPSDRVMFGDPQYRGTFEALYRVRKLLFVGCSLSDDDLDVTIALVSELAGDQPPQHFAVLEGPVLDYRRQSLEQAGIRIFEYPKGNHNLVVEFLQELGGKRKPAATASVSDTGSSTRAGLAVSISAEADIEPLLQRPPNDPSNRESLVLRAASRGTPGLIDELERFLGSVLAGIYRIDSLENMGSQFAVFRGTHLHQNKPIAIKLPFVDYTRPASFGRREIELARSAATREWESLSRHRDRVPTLPWPYELVRASNLLLDGRGSDPVWTQEMYLVEEWIEGSSFDDVRQQLFSSIPSGERIMEVVLPLMTSLLSALARLEPELFADVSPRNFIWCNRTKTTRLVDAGSLVAPGTPIWVTETSGTGASGRITTAVTLPYLSARDFGAYCRGESREVQSTGVLFAIGKMFCELATNLHPLNGQDPVLSAAPYASLPRQLREAIDRLLSGTLGSMSAATSAIIDVAGRGAK